MKVDMVTTDDWFVLVIDGKRVDNGHNLLGVEAFEIIADRVKNSKSYIGSFTFKEIYLDVAVGDE